MHNTIIEYREKWRGIPVHNVYWSNCNCSTATCIVTIIVYRGMWRGIPVHNVYWSNCNFSTSTCIMTIIHRRTDKNYTLCFSSQLTPVYNKWHTHTHTHNSLRKSVNALFDLHDLLITFIFSVSNCVILLTDTISFLPISTDIHWIKFFLSFLFRRFDFCLNSLIFMILFAWKIIAVSHRLLGVYSFCSWTKPYWFSLFWCTL